MKSIYITLACLWACFSIPAYSQLSYGAKVGSSFTSFSKDNSTSNAQGAITGITGTLGNGYRSQASLTIGGGGTGAVVRVNYQSTVAVLGTAVPSIITAGGTGYTVAPTAIFTGFSATGQPVSESRTTTINNGSVVNFSTSGQVYTSAPTVVVVPQERTTAFGTASANNSGQLNSIGINDSGSGYNPLVPPAVTIRDLRGGTGATAIAITNAGGTIAGIQLLTRGSGYSTVGYANFPTSYVSFNTDGDYEDMNDNGIYDNGDLPAVKLKPGATKIINAYYGTGVHSQPLYYND